MVNPPPPHPTGLTPLEKDWYLTLYRIYNSITFALILDSFVCLAVTSNASNIILITFPPKRAFKNR